MGAADDFAPIVIADLELSQPLDPILPTDPRGVAYGGARVLVRMHSRPLGVVDLPMSSGGVPASACARAIWETLGPKLNDHLRADSLPEVSGLDEHGLPAVTSPRCTARRREVLEDPPPASVVICTRNRPQVLERALHSLRKLEYSDFEVIVVDGSATPETDELIRAQFADVRYSSVGDKRKAFALNRGVEMASGSFVAFTDDDAVVDRWWLAELVARFDNERVACVTGPGLPLEIATQAQLWFEESGAFTDGFEPRLIGLDLPPEPGSLLPYATGKIGAGLNVAWRTTTLRELGGFDVSLDNLIPPRSRDGTGQGATQDLAMFFDALVAGYQIAFEPGAIVFHQHRRTYDELLHQKYWHGVGLGAYLTRSLLRRPSLIPGFVMKVPRGLRYGFASASRRNAAKSATFPRALTRAEWRGVIHGPFAYVKGLRATGRFHAERSVERGL